MIQVICLKDGVWGWTTPPKTAHSVSKLFKGIGDCLHNIEDKRNIFFSLANHNQNPGAHRSSSTFDYQSVMGFDLDKNPDIVRWNEYAFALAKVLKVSPQSLVVNCSGNGLQFLAHLRHPIRHATYFAENRNYYKAILELVEKDLKAMGLTGQFDRNIFDAARVLRLPGTINSKPGKPDKECTNLQWSEDQATLDLRELSGHTAFEEENVSPGEVRQKYPRPDFKEIVKECLFVKEAIETPSLVHEPDAFDLFSLLSAVNPEDKVDLGGTLCTAEEVALHVYNGATESVSLERQDFASKWDQAGKYGARKCTTIDQKWGKCRTCPHYGRVVTPLQLKSKEHIGSEVNGYWVLNSKSAPTHPHYEDLAKLYQKEHEYRVTPEESFYTFTKTHYRLSSPISAKSWLENKLVPTDPIREVHRNEFVHKVKARGVMTTEEQTELFEETIRGKLNCKNGIVDIKRGKLLPHSPDVGFQYCLDYDYIEGQSSELFLDWISQITEDRVELMESILDVMAYCLWPNYDDHIFVYLVGDGGNGKSTLIRIIEEIVGKQNISSASIFQLTTNRFAPASLEGKLVNLSGESSGASLGSNELNVLKTLSSSETLEVERKNQNSFSFRNKAKLIFSANKVPRFSESGDSIKRRLLVLPFDHRITKPDPNIEYKLLEEVPKILSMLVRRIQANMLINRGLFKVSRGGSDALEAQKKFLTAGSTSIEWAKEHLTSSSELSEDVWVDKAEAYSEYTQWCLLAGYKYPDTRTKFTQMLDTCFVTKAVTETDRIRNASGQRIRVFRRTQRKGESDET